MILKIEYSNAKTLSFIKDQSINLILNRNVGSIFKSEDTTIQEILDNEQGDSAFELMHRQLDIVWQECYRVLAPGAFLCINIGDATRYKGKRFKLYSNHFQILHYCHQLGLDTLPLILWRKQTNAPM